MGRVTLIQTAADLQRAQQSYAAQAGEARHLVSEIRRAEAVVVALTTRIEDLDQISAFLSGYADARQEAVHTQIEAIVTQGLRSIFSEDLTLRLLTRQVGRRPELDFVLVSGQGADVLETSILDARGGGVAAVAGFLIQAVLVLLTPGLRPLLFLDEVFAQVSAEYEEPLAEFISELVARSPLQVVLVTHSAAFGTAADRQYRFSQTGGATHVEEVK